LDAETLQNGSAGLFDHPASALLPLSPEWLETLRNAATFLKQATLWSVIPPSDLDWKQTALDGRSHGAAAARAFWHLGQGLYPDPGILVLAELSKPLIGSEHFELAGVKGIEPKIRAGLEPTANIDTICVVDRDVTDDHKRTTNNAQTAYSVLKKSGRIDVHLEVLDVTAFDKVCPHCQAMKNPR
jgi:hypothetical protein